MKRNSFLLSSVKDLVNRVNTNKTGVFSRTPKLIATLDPRLAKLVGDNRVHVSEFIIAKIKGLIHGFNGHPEITDEVFGKLPCNINNPREILVDKRAISKYLFIAKDPIHVVVIEVARKESGKTEINTVYLISEKERRRLDKYPIAFNSVSGGTPTPSYMPRS